LKDLGYQEQPPANNVDLSTVDSLKKTLAEKDEQLDKAAMIMKSMLNKMAMDVKQAITDRFNNIVSKGVMERAAADELLKSKLEFQLSLKPDGNFEPHPLETTLSALESLPARTGGQGVPQGTVHQHPFGVADNAPPPADLQKRISDLLSRLG
jgi:hypothetical protein